MGLATENTNSTPRLSHWASRLHVSLRALAVLIPMSLLYRYQVLGRWVLPLAPPKTVYLFSIRKARYSEPIVKHLIDLTMSSLIYAECPVSRPTEVGVVSTFSSPAQSTQVHFSWSCLPPHLVWQCYDSPYDYLGLTVFPQDLCLHGWGNSKIGNFSKDTNTIVLGYMRWDRLCV